MHIVLLTGEYPPQPGGVGDYTYRLMLALANQGLTVQTITFQDQQWCVYEAGAAAPGQVRHPVKTDVRWIGSGGWNWLCWSAIIALLDQLRPDVLHIQYQTGAYGMHPAINFLPWRLRGLRGRPYVLVTLHDLLEPYLLPKAHWLRRYVTLRLVHDADQIIVTNAEDQARLQATGDAQSSTPGRWGTLDNSNLTVIPIGSNIAVAPPADFEREAWRSRLGISPSTRLVAYFGLLSHSKGCDLLLDALWRLKNKPGGDYRLVLIGGAATTAQDRAYASAIAAQIARLGIGDTVVQTGHVDEASVSAHLLAADCVVLPFRDGASFRRGSLLAALAHSQAVITTTPTHMPDPPSPRLIDGDNVLLMPPNDTNALIETLEHLFTQPALHMRLCRGAQELARQFDWPAIAHQHELVYRRQSSPAHWHNS